MSLVWLLKGCQVHPDHVTVRVTVTVTVIGGQIEPADFADLVLVQCNTESERVIVET
jgi:hypothetical protein